MSVRIENGYPAVSLEQISAFEADKQIELPEMYKTFLLRHNGGQPTPDRLAVPGWYGGFTGVNSFLGIQPGKQNTLEQVCEDYKQRIPKQFLPIGDDMGGNLICIGLGKKHWGMVFLWDHEDELDENGRSRMDMGNMYKVAENISDLIENKLLPGK